MINDFIIIYLCQSHQTKYIQSSIQININIYKYATMLGYQTYISSIKAALNAALCLRDFPSTLFEKDNKPYIQLTGYNTKLDCLILKPIFLARNKKQTFLIQSSINSCRVSFSIRKNDQIDRLITAKFSNMAASRAQMFQVLRRKPIQGFDVTFLITSDLLEKYNKDLIIKLIIELVVLEKEVTNIKLNINTQARIAATFFADQLINSVDNDLF